MLDELEIVRAMLAVNGEAAPDGATLTSTHPSVQQAVEQLRRTLKDFQARGWWFNRERNIKLLPDNFGKITVPAETLEFAITAADQVKASGYDNERYVTHGRKVYDNLEHTYVIGKALYVDLILMRAVEELPAHAASYLKHLCAQEHYVNDDGDLNKAKLLQDRVDRAWFELYSAELKITKKNALQSPMAMTLRYRMQQNGISANPNLIGGR